MLSINNTTEGYLKNVEIKGNTIQDSLGVGNLADIKSVGDKVEGQDLYEIPLLCTGKNKFKCVTEGVRYGYYTDNLTWVANPTNVCFDNYSVKLEIGKYTASSNNCTPSALYEFDNNGNIISRIQGVQDVANKTTVFDVIKNGNYKLGINRLEGDLSSLTIQLEEGTQVTPYEPYQENKLTILSPVQLEKGDVLKEVDGVWGVEKNRVDKILTHELSYNAYQTLTNVAKFWVSVPDVVNERGLNIISDKFVAKDMITSLDEEGICTYTGGRVYFGVLKSKISTNINDYIKNNPILIKYPTTTPTFISLPHTQQIKLRTFANRTNISFLCDVEGTIKADVPKSLGATVNTHTTQIDALNQELDRVKKLEESTISTVVTESDFTVVEQTSNGYFEDMELNGRTLVNILPDKQSQVWRLSTGDTTCYKSYKYDKKLEVGKTYTYLCYNVPSKITEMYLGDSNGASIAIPWGKFYNTSTFVATSELAELNLLTPHFRNRTGELLTLSDIENIKVIILEGDHTQNPPQYFERLASVGDGTDEIVVSTCNNEPIEIDFTDDNGVATKIPNPLHKADKKKLLYFDQADNTWKKPILDEFSTVKKGSDGVYRYCQGGLTRAYKAGDETNANCITDMTNTVEKVQEKVYECTNMDLITYPNETNFTVKSGVLTPRTTLKVHNNISNVVSLLQKKVSLLESNISKYMITQNRLQLASTYSADSVTFKVDYASMSDNKSVDSYDEDLYNLILHNILTGKDNYDYDKMFNIVMDYASWKQITWDQFDALVGIMDLQYYPPVVEPPTEEIPPVEVKVKKVRNKKASTK